MSAITLEAVLGAVTDFITAYPAIIIVFAGVAIVGVIVSAAKRLVRSR